MQGGGADKGSNGGPKSFINKFKIFLKVDCIILMTMKVNKGSIQ